jgi:hypothetical protein
MRANVCLEAVAGFDERIRIDVDSGYRFHRRWARRSVR